MNLIPHSNVNTARNLRKIGRFVLILVSLLFLISACSAGVEPEEGLPIELPSDNITIALVTDILELDNDYYNLTYGGLRSISARTGADFITVDVTDPEFDSADFADLAADGLDIVVMLGFTTPPLFVEFSEQYPDIHFISIDYPVETYPDNATSILFKEGDVGYLAGTLAAKISQTGMISGIYGNEQIPAIVSFAEGYESGAKSVNPEIEVLTEYHPSTDSLAFNDPEWGAATAVEHMDSGVDVIFTAAGATGPGALKAVAELSLEGDDLYCIGVDSDQWVTIEEARPCLVSSAIKNIPRAIDDVITLIINDSAPSGVYFGPVGLAPFHDFSEQFADIEAELEQLSADIEAGVVEPE